MGCHQGTFGSVVRFHAFDDPETEVIICHNLEYLTSPRDQDRTDKWLESGKQYHWYCFWRPKGQYGNVLEHNTKPTIIATFSAIKQKGKKLGYFSVELEKKYRNYPYGIDEYILTKLLKHEMILKNTFITDCMYDLEDVGELFTESKKIISEFCRDNDISTISNDPDIGVSFIKYHKNILDSLGIDEFIVEDFQDSFHKYLFENFKRGEVIDLPEDFIFFYIGNNINPKLKEIDRKNIIIRSINYSLYTNSIINCIDFPGFCVKRKRFGRDKKVSDKDNKNALSIYFNTKI